MPSIRPPYRQTTQPRARQASLYLCWLCLALCLGCHRTTVPTAPAASPTAQRTTAQRTATPTADRQVALVVFVADGDTIHVLIGGQRYKLRYIGMNCPEVGQPYFEQATQANSDLVMGETVYLEKDVSETDRYGRLLRYVYLGDEMVNGLLVEQGLAYASTYPPDVKYQDYLRALEREARDAQRGLWGEETDQGE